MDEIPQCWERSRTESSQNGIAPSSLPRFIISVKECVRMLHWRILIAHDVCQKNV